MQEYSFFLWKYRIKEEEKWSEWYFRAQYFAGSRRGMIPEDKENEVEVRLNFEAFARCVASFDGISHYLLADDPAAADRIDASGGGFGARVQLARVCAEDLAKLDELIMGYLQKKSTKKS